MKWDAEVRSAIAHWAPVYGVTLEPELIHGIIEKESRHGAAGLETLEPDGDRSYGPMMVKTATASSVLHIMLPATLKDPALGISAGVHYFASLVKRFGGDVQRAISGYNAGPGNAVRNKATGTFPNQTYVTNVLSFWNLYKREAAAAAPVVVTVLAISAFLLLRGTARRRRAA